MTMDPDAAALDALRRRYPHWTINVSGSGRFWAMTRDRAFCAASEMRAFLDADAADELDDMLAEQERLRGRRPGLGDVEHLQSPRDTA
ncbi:hypothetical protein ACBJ59_61430 [Nonomuraea sp. MTCD27]|uniref:hypothetical protein n=1 Tax=Nonomuraea sp. MTCD27 TaxID=1676747 RepID=UPI0035C0F977